jgi:poly-gamma-glutamate synthesis protein (capsule biosynthesis protein)
MKKHHCFRAVPGFIITAAVCALFLSSCRGNTPVDGIMLMQGEEFVREREFLGQLFLQPDFPDALGLRLIQENETDKQTSALLIEFTASWTQTEGIPVSRTWFIPREDPLEERTGISLASCLDGNETLIPLEELAPPYMGLLVDGLNVADENYPLVRYVSIRVREAESGIGATGGAKVSAGEKKRLVKKITALETILALTPMPLVQDPPSVVWICVAGDLMLDKDSSDILLKEGVAGIFGKTAKYFEKSDVNLVNLEGAVSTRGEKVVKSFNFRFDPQTLPPLKAAGINAVLLANNHTFDYGETAFFDTLENLEKNGITALGAGRDIDAAAAPFVFETDRLEIRVFGIASYPRERNGWDGTTVSATKGKAGLLFAGRGGAERLKENLVREGGVLNVLLFHGGYEWTWKPDASTRNLYTELALSGADLIVGTHPHTVQGFEWLEGKLVFWSLGNFVFAGNEGTDGGEEGLLFRLGYAGKTPIYFEPVPVKLTGSRSEIGSAEQLKRFYALSRELRNR